MIKVKFHKFKIFKKGILIALSIFCSTYFSLDLVNMKTFKIENKNYLIYFNYFSVSLFYLI